MKQKFQVTGMTCSACSATVERNVKKLEGVKEVTVNLLSNSMVVSYDEDKVNNQTIIDTVVKAGYQAALAQKNNQKKTSSIPAVSPVEQDIKNMKFRLIVSFIFLIPLMYISMGHMFGAPLPNFLTGNENALSFALTQFLLTLPIVYVNRKYFQAGFKNLVKLHPNMDSLIAIGSSAALIYGVFAIYQIGIGLGYQDMETVHHYTMDLYFESSAMILALITLGKFLETKSKGKTSEAITKLLHLAPKTATVIRNGEEQEIPVEEVVVGDRIVIKPGQSIPVDGVIIEGSSSVDQSALTGESIPVEKNVGDKVIAASVNKMGSFHMEAQKVGDDTTLAQIIQLVEDANASKAPIAKLADKISGIFVPVVITIAVIATIVWLILGYPFEFALSIGIAVLVISCPCALGLATPVAIMVGTGKGAEYGILIKSAEALEVAHSVKTVVLDKTGTITEGKPKVTDIVPSEYISEQELLSVAASMEKPSEHPLADAIVAYAQEKKVSLLPTEHFKAVSGQGITASINGTEYYAGNISFISQYVDVENFEELSNTFADQGKTPLYFADSNHILGVIAVADVVKPTSAEAISQLKDMHIDVVMLTGDHKKTAQAIQKQLGIDRVVAEVLPQDKEREIRALQEGGHKVAMVGDGINDAPALARADVGIAIGAGTDIAIESADIVLMKNSLLDVVTAIRLSKATIRNIKENLFWAFFYNSIGIPLAAGVFFSLLGWKLNPMFGAAAMSLSSVCVVLNALRLKFFKPRHMMSVSENLQGNTEICPIQTVAEQSASPIVSQIENNQTKDEGEKQVMTKIMNINGMSCGHCKATVEKILNGFDGVHATVDLDKKCAVMEVSGPIDEKAMMDAVNEAGFEAISVE
ncbi:MAG: heavy metal translocating P-type ATPase [Clostridium sp.]|nr:heavy metal translocating P-type ATPase [Clostridium sp.]